MIRTHTELTNAVRQARTMVSTLRHGARFTTTGERELIAALLETLADVAERGANKAGITDA